MTIEIRQAGPQDAEGIAFVGKQSFTETFLPAFVSEKDCIDYVNHTYSTQRVAASLSNPGNQYFIALVNGMIAGFVKNKPGSRNENVLCEAPIQLQRIYVLPEFISKGIGQRLLSKALENAYRCGGQTLWLAVYVHNNRAIDFYLRHGFEITGDHFYTIGTQEFHFYILSKPVLMEACPDISVNS
ncbi:MAG TPA: N-acetyltransferase [Flavisolibacter sp.]|nr:N-acetyltransferase [Flavisolibacter sp.]